MTRDLKRQIQVLWKTDEVRAHKPTVEDEIRNQVYEEKRITRFSNRSQRVQADAKVVHRLKQILRELGY